MIRPDYRGARGSNAGDDFHELWALRHALTLLDQNSTLTAVTVEGLKAEDERGIQPDTWDGVDCTLYYGGDKSAFAERIVITQLRYSSARPDQEWTVSRLTQSSSGNQPNSIIRKLAKAFSALKDKHPDLVERGNLIVCFVSNQPVDDAVVHALAVQKASDASPNGQPQHAMNRAKFRSASGLQGENFESFARSFEFECGQESRFGLEESILSNVSEWIEDDARAQVEVFMRYIRRAMMPDARNQVITRHSILAQLGFSDPGALFPCPNKIERTERLILREATRSVIESLGTTAQRICLHGTAGCGKTTLMHEIESLLPHESIFIIFDCYGGGTYQNADAYRHRSKDAFLHLANELASRLRIPLFVNRSRDLDYPRVFKKRLEKAAHILKTTSENALLVIVVDAADNSVTAAATRSPPERSFVHDFMMLGDIPENVRLLVTARTGRLPDLDPPPGFVSRDISGFTRNETAVHVRGIWPDEVPEAWIEDFHHLSQGNPRVQRYALDHASGELSRALDFLRPHGKTLYQVFANILTLARQKAGLNDEIMAFCSGLIALPRPIPVAALTAITDLREAQIRDLCSDMAPGVRIEGGSVEFADEDFEDFIRTEAQGRIDQARTRVADYLYDRRNSDAYAAIHVAAALFDAGRGEEIIGLVRERQEPTAIADPILRRETQLQRLRIAMRVCRQTGNVVDAMLTLLVGAEALKTDDVIQRMLVDYPDLTAVFAREISGRMILLDASKIEKHGPLLCHLMAVDARDGNRIAVREGWRQFNAWMRRRQEDFAGQKKQRDNAPSHGWSINDFDIAAETEAVLRISGPVSAMAHVSRWRPKSIAQRVASILSYKLIASGEAHLVEDCITKGAVSTPWDMFLLIPLALAGREIDIARLEKSLEKLKRRHLIRPEKLLEAAGDNSHAVDYLEEILTACEIVIARKGNLACVIPILESFANPELRRCDTLSTSRILRIDLTLRAHTLAERLAGREVSMETYLVEPPKSQENLPSHHRRGVRQSNIENQKVRDFLRAHINTYDTRCQILLGMISPGEAKARLQDSISSYHDQGYRVSGDVYARPMRTLAALSITRLMALHNISPRDIYDCVDSFLQTRSNPFDTTSRTDVFKTLALNSALHGPILEVIADCAKAVRNTKTPSEEKLSALVEFTQLLFPISPTDSKCLFNEAVEAAGEVDYESVYEIALFKPLAQRAVSNMDEDQRREAARDIAIIVGDAGVRLEGFEHFPWDAAAWTLSKLSISVALAALGRWADSSVVHYADFLPSALRAALDCREQSLTLIAALMPLLEHIEPNLIAQIAKAARLRGEGIDLNALAENLAHDELLYYGRGQQPAICEALRSLLPVEQHGFWLSKLCQATTFHLTEKHAVLEDSGSHNTDDRKRWEEKQQEVLDSVDWGEYQFLSEEEILRAVTSVLASAKEAETFISESMILDHIRGLVELRHRSDYLEALTRIACRQESSYKSWEFAQGIAKSVQDWRDTPAIRLWYQKRFMRVLVDLLPGFSRYIESEYGECPLPTLLEQCGVPDQEICDALLEGIERHVGELQPSTIWTLVGLVGRYCAPEEAAKVLAGHASRLARRIPESHQDKWDLTDIPVEATEGLARLLYALMGDIDVRIRWRAAHVARRLARLGDTDTLDSFVGLYDKKAEASYRLPDAPFYWLAARLWLVMTLDRIAAEMPSAVRTHGHRLLAIASDQNFPHVLIRAFAKSAVDKLVENDTFAIDNAQQRLLNQVNVSPIPQATARRPHQSEFRDFHNQHRDLRFCFDWTDTLPYWYSPALRVFADLRQKEYIETAERWIVDRWGVRENPWRWIDEPRKRRFSSNSLSSCHSHGSMPVLERYHTYLEWHAMWCATGELMQTHSLSQAREDAYDTFEHWLCRAGLTSPPSWLADFLGPKPLERRLWYPPKGNVDAWRNNVIDADFMTEIGLIAADGSIGVNGHNETQSDSFYESIDIETSLVSRDTARALLRALQTAEEPSCYRLPPTEHDLEIDIPRYKLLGWLSEIERDLGIDKHDILRYEVNEVRCRPAKNTLTALNLKFVHGNQAEWVDAESEGKAFCYEIWGDGPARSPYDPTLRSNGFRLRIEREALKTFLDKVGFDLIVEIQIKRRNQGYGYRIYDEKEGKESCFVRILVLRADGSIEGAEGHLGAWLPPCT